MLGKVQVLDGMCSGRQVCQCVGGVFVVCGLCEGRRAAGGMDARSMRVQPLSVPSIAGTKAGCLTTTCPCLCRLCAATRASHLLLGSGWTAPLQHWTGASERCKHSVLWEVPACCQPELS